MEIWIWIKMHNSKLRNMNRPNSKTIRIMPDCTYKERQIHIKVAKETKKQDHVKAEELKEKVNHSE